MNYMLYRDAAASVAEASATASTTGSAVDQPSSADAFEIGDHIQVLMKESEGRSWYWRNATVVDVAADGYSVIFYKASTERVFFEKSKTRVCGDPSLSIKRTMTSASI